MGIGKSDLYLVVVIYHHADRFSIYHLIFPLFSTVTAINIGEMEMWRWPDYLFQVAEMS